MLKEYGLEGVRTLEIKVLPDERGFFSEALRNDWTDFIDEWIAQVNISHDYPYTVRAWHRYPAGQVGYFLVLRGAVKICAYDEETQGLAEVIGSEHKLAPVRVPGHYYHGFKTISNVPSLTVCFVNRLSDGGEPGEERIPWNDPGIVPLAINGNRGDPRAGQPWDWFYPAHK